MINIAQTIKPEREKQGITTKALAKKAGYMGRDITYIETKQHMLNTKKRTY